MLTGLCVGRCRRNGVEAVEERVMQAVEKEIAVVTQTLEAEK